MNLFVALCTLATLCFIRASALEEYDHDVEDLDLEMDMELERDLEEYDGDDQDEEENSEGRKRPHKNPFCERTFYKHTGLGGQCLSPDEMGNQTCDFIKNGGIEVEIRKKKVKLCHDDKKYCVKLCHDDKKYCCVNCNVPKQSENCRKAVGADFLAPARRVCCAGELVLKPLICGCNCCGKCKPNKRYCTKKGGFCVTKYGTGGPDPELTFDFCTDPKGCHGKLYSKRCEGKDCKCCICAN